MLSAEGVRAKLDAGGFSVRGKCEFIFHYYFIVLMKPFYTRECVLFSVI